MGAGVGTCSGVGDGVGMVDVTCFVAVATRATDVAPVVGVADGIVLASLPAEVVDDFVVVAAAPAIAHVQMDITRSSVRHPSPHCVLRFALRNCRQRRWCGNGGGTGAGGGYPGPGYVGWLYGFVYIISFLFTITTSITIEIIDV